MCTLSFVPLQTGFALAMNRDEQKTRVKANPPTHHRMGRMRALYPAEPGGGTWFGVNSRGIALALLNWYEKTPVGPQLNKVSRGSIIPRLLECEKLAEMEDRLNEQAFLSRRLPFRLIGFQPLKNGAESGLVTEWKWDENALLTISHPWKTQHWFSSGHDEPGANRVRAGVVSLQKVRGGADVLNDLRSLHASHLPESGPYSICMHRDDAQTVSYCESLINETTAQMRYCKGPLCENSKALIEQELALTPLE